MGRRGASALAGAAGLPPSPGKMMVVRDDDDDKDDGTPPLILLPTSPPPPTTRPAAMAAARLTRLRRSFSRAVDKASRSTRTYRGKSSFGCEDTTASSARHTAGRRAWLGPPPSSANRRTREVSKDGTHGETSRPVSATAARRRLAAPTRWSGSSRALWISVTRRATAVIGPSLTTALPALPKRAANPALPLALAPPASSRPSPLLP
mmetsp:Transcript_16043/g.28847  ORF Transcript_16043/g.28847 Transcript_16043/m.28847 type:complete len:207 (-) Transcript_16043:1594-2214(-)